MRRINEGKKSKFIDNDAIAEICRIYTDFIPSEISKIFDYQEFGYRKIKVQRPLRYTISITEESIVQFKSCKEFTKLSSEIQRAVENYLVSHLGNYTFAQFLAEILPFIPVSRMTKSLKNIMIKTFGIKDPNAPPAILDGEILFDPDLADFERVPLLQDVQAYMEKEVLPYIPDAVIDESENDAKDGKVGKVGYEINFNRYFYQFEQPRHPNEILTEIKVLSAEVAELLSEI